MSTWAKMQQTIDELRAELNSIQTTTAWLDGALVERVAREHKYTSTNGAVELNCATGEIKLAGVGVAVEEQAGLCIDPGQEVEPLRMGKVTFYGESARQIRAANAVLQSAGAGQLEVVKRDEDLVKAFAVEGGRVFVLDRFVAQAGLRTAVTEQGKRVATGIGLGEHRSESTAELADAIASLISPADLKITNPADHIRQVLRDELKPGGMLHRG
ncbi:hypothetical protein P0Y43_09900 [Pseudomonas entomophila]|uniref:hypothetical protein n=1 Tax=Pseudomonas entomophila TaxID=312306 RepID=UPI0023D84DBD|nr:hypothetical protein [Pseudomonas entomophila]MDF0731035.1 hypothetical protein [Pseudomonas entomophila]